MNFADQLDRLSDPLAQSIIVVCFALLSLCWRHYRVGAVSIVLALLWSLLCSTPAFATWMQRGLENQFPTKLPMAYVQADAIVVLGGYAMPSGESRWANQPAVADTRIGYGYLLYATQRAPIILLSGGNGDAIRMQREISRQGVPPSAIRTETTSRTTYENAVNSSKILQHEGEHRILLVTSRMHMPRALALFKHQGIEVTPAPSLEPDTYPAKAGAWRPQRAALSRSGRCLHEYLGLWSYKIAGLA